jgi:flagellar hook-associated protein 3 FlgL
MRVTSKSVYMPFQRNLEEIQSRRNLEQMKLSTGKEFHSLSQGPEKIVDAKNFTKKIDQNKKYIDIVDETTLELYEVDEKLRNFSDRIQKIRELTIESTPTGVTPGLASLGFWIKGHMDDMINDLNSDYNGHYLFSGTKTTAQSISNVEGENNKPFELIEETPTAENPSGFKVVFKGNNEERIINTDPKNVEKINVNANEILTIKGKNIFDSIINIYNVLSYRDDGEKRIEGEPITPTELKKINDLQAELANIYDEVNKVSGRNGTKINRLTSLSEQLQNENVRLQDYRSFKEDADMVDVSMNLKREENALNYTLQVGGTLNNTTLFDFLR